MADQQRDRDVEAVLFDLEGDEETLRRAAIFAVAKLGERAVAAIPLLQQIAGADPSVELRYLARKCLGALAAQGQAATSKVQVRKSAGMTQMLALSGAEMVAVKLASPDAHVRASAYRAVGLKRDPALLSSLLTRVGPDKEPDAELRSLLVRILAIVGGKSQLKAVAWFLEDLDARVRSNAIEALAQFQDVMAYALIAKALQDSDHRVQVASATALQAIGSLNIYKVGAVMMKSDAYWCRDAAIFMLGQAKIKEATPILETALTDPHESVRIKAKAGLQRLADLGHEPANEALKKAAGIKDKEDLFASFLALEKEAPKPLTKVSDEIAHKDVGTRRKATRQVAALGILDEGSIPLLLAQLKVEADPTAQANLIKAVGNIKNPVVLPALLQYVGHENEQVRAAIADALAAIGTDEALNAALPLLRDPSPKVLGRAILALRKHPYIDIGRPLDELANNSTDCRKMACMVIAELADAKYLPVLQRLATDTNGEVAEMGRDTIKMLGGGQEAPQVVVAATKLPSRTIPPPDASLPESPAADARNEAQLQCDIANAQEKLRVLQESRRAGIVQLGQLLYQQHQDHQLAVDGAKGPCEELARIDQGIADKTVEIERVNAASSGDGMFAQVKAGAIKLATVGKLTLEINSLRGKRDPAVMKIGETAYRDVSITKASLEVVALAGQLQATDEEILSGHKAVRDCEARIKELREAATVAEWVAASPPTFSTDSTHGAESGDHPIPAALSADTQRTDSRPPPSPRTSGSFALPSGAAKSRSSSKIQVVQQVGEAGQDARNDRDRHLIYARIAGVLHVLLGLGWLGLVGFQFLLGMMHGAINKDASLLMLASWNLIMVVAYFALAYGCFATKRWGFDWGIGTNVLNVVLGGSQLISGVWIQGLFLPFSMANCLLLWWAKPVFPTKEASPPRGGQIGTLAGVGIILAAITGMYIAFEAYGYWQAGRREGAAKAGLTDLVNKYTGNGSAGDKAVKKPAGGESGGQTSDAEYESQTIASRQRGCASNRNSIDKLMRVWESQYVAFAKGIKFSACFSPDGAIVKEQNLSILPAPKNGKLVTGTTLADTLSLKSSDTQFFACPARVGSGASAHADGDYIWVLTEDGTRGVVCRTCQAEAFSAQPASQGNSPNADAGFTAGVTLANFKRLNTGMSYAEACRILGEQGEEMSKSEFMGVVTVMYVWKAGGISNMNAMFQNDRLMSKAQLGLE